MAVSINAKNILDELSGSPKMGDIKKLAKEIKRDHKLAFQLWATDDYFPRLLASLIFDTKSLTDVDIRQFASDLSSHTVEQQNQLGDWLLASQLTKHKKLIALMESWQNDSSAVLRRWYWYHEARKRWMGREQPAGSSAALLDAIEATIGNETSEVQWVMNFCAGWIGVFEEDLRDRCIKLGETTGLYKDEIVAKNCTPAYLPEFIRIETAKRN